MIDTSPEMEARYRAMLLTKTAEQRLEMACSMFEFAKTLAASMVLSERPGISNGELRAEVFRRFYAKDFEPEQLEKIARHLEQVHIDNPA